VASQDGVPKCRLADPGRTSSPFLEAVMGEYADIALEAEINEWLEELTGHDSLESALNACPSCGLYFERCIC
jgi:hypothetical protein